MDGIFSKALVIILIMVPVIWKQYADLMPDVLIALLSGSMVLLSLLIYFFAGVLNNGLNYYPLTFVAGVIIAFIVRYDRRGYYLEIRHGLIYDIFFCCGYFSLLYILISAIDK